MDHCVRVARHPGAAVAIEPSLKTVVRHGSWIAPDVTRKRQGRRAKPAGEGPSRWAGWARRSIDDEKLRPKLRVGAVRFCVVCDLVAHARLERELAPIFKLGVKFTFGAQKYVTLDTPVICEVAGRVLDHADTDVSKLPGAPVSDTTFAFVFASLDLRPVSRAERNG